MRAEFGLILIIAGFSLLFIAALLPLAFAGSASISGGGCIIILFFPICFGVGDQPAIMMVIAMALAVALIVLSYFVLKLMGRAVSEP